MMLAVSSVAWIPAVTVKAVAVDLTCTWDAGGADENFSTAANWDDVLCTKTNMEDDAAYNLKLVFPVMANSADRLPVNDLAANTKVSLITITGGGYTIGGTNALTLMGDINLSSSTDDNTISTPFVLGSNMSFTNSSYILFLDSTINLSTFTATFTGGSIIINGIISSGVGGNIVHSSGDISLTAANTFKGTFSSTSGLVSVQNKAAFGDSTSGTTIGANATIMFINSIREDETWAEPFIFNGTPNPGFTSKIVLYGDTNNQQGIAGPYYVFSGAVTIGADVKVGNLYQGSADLKITGAITGPTYKITPLDGIDLTVVLAGSSNTTATANGTYKSAVNTVTVSNDLNTTNNTFYYNNALIVQAPSGKYGNVTLAGGTLSGTGTVKNITMSSGKVAPGLSPGCLTSNNLAYTGGQLSIEINGTTVCTEYDQQTVTGTVSLGANVTTLTVTKLSGYNAKVDDKFTIIDNDGSDAVSSTFKGLAEGATFTSDGVTYKISYVGGDGNDVVLTVTAIPGTPNTGTYQGTYTSAVVFGGLSIAAGVYMLGGKRFKLPRRRK